ncbi:hypothetical protein EEL32_22545 [Brevibacillus laterosporus]|nr:hypothetical protein [Brevibacillus laterosporus]TPG77711.1 hypothetical protein EEL32_22545 [Brevibacillus laterosporus]
MITDRCVCYYESELPCPYCKRDLIAELEHEVERLRKLTRLMEPCVDYDKFPYSNHLWREVMGVITHEQGNQA